MCSQLPVDSIVVTGLEQDTVLEIPPCRVANLVYESGSITITDNEKFPAAYCGTGDVFAAFCAASLHQVRPLRRQFVPQLILLKNACRIRTITAITAKTSCTECSLRINLIY